MKARYDYGLMIFILTFCLVSVSGYQDEEVLDLAHKRLTTILIGSAIAVFVSIGICPVWAGDDLHKLVVANLEKLGNFLEGTWLHLLSIHVYTINAELHLTIYIAFFFQDLRMNILKFQRTESPRITRKYFKVTKVFSLQKAVKIPWWDQYIIMFGFSIISHEKWTLK